ncbi:MULTISPECIES: MerR family transcriptional regulator [unclassified Clostridium]|uniref:MerR family transcriptional regulator n=1 Tax=unclassified Clostridium TaxID=2614128 RepID=UPI001485D7E2|nr:MULTISPECIES: MerR family transcriptional regulator [unclassified Clostridium]
MRNEEEKYTIGQIAEICGISKKVLRYYDRNGILVPAYRGESSNYRYYIESQIAEILLLKELRELKFPVKVIWKLFSDRNLKGLEEELERWMGELRVEQDELQKRYDKTLEFFLRVVRGGISIKKEKGTNSVIESDSIQIIRFHKRHVVYTRYRSFLNAKKLFISRRAELLRIATENKYEVIGANMAVFHSGYLKQFNDTEEDNYGDLEVFIEVKEGNESEYCREIGDFDAVSGVFVGPYQEMKGFYERLESYAKRHRIELEGISVEEYLVGATMTNTSNDFVTRIYLPFKGQFYKGE